MPKTTQHVSNVDHCIQQIIERVGERIVICMPLGLGKPNQLINALYLYAKQHSEIQLKIITALSLDIPQPKQGLEQAFLQPFLERVFGDYCRLVYIPDIKNNTVPNNIEIHSFFLKSGEYVGVDYAQQNYISSNYTLVTRDVMHTHKVNVCAQSIAIKQGINGARYSLSSNPDTSLDVHRQLEQEPTYQDYPLIFVGQVHHDLPFMENDAEVAEDFFDIILDDPALSTELFSTPNQAVALKDHMIGMYASSLVKDGGTLQIGIGSMSDAIVNALLLRQNNNGLYRQIIGALQPNTSLIEEYGGLAPIERGLYGCSEMFVNGFRHLIEAGIIKRRIYETVEAQLRDNRGEANPDHEPSFFMHGGFFLGPRDFYQWLRELPEETHKKICMSSVGLINQLAYAPPLLRAQRIHARFINTGFIATMTGSIVSDATEDMQVVSGVGGQYNFVAMGHQLADARSIIMIRAVREGKNPSSNIRFSYGHCTIPRHLRDIVITEYGIADLRGKSDQDCIKAMLNIADSRFQQQLMQQAKAAGKLDQRYTIPPQFTHNTPQALKEQVAHIDQSAFPAFPLGTDLTELEITLAGALKKMKALTADKLSMAKVLASQLSKPIPDAAAPYLQRMGLAEPASLEQKMSAKLLVWALGH